MAACLEWLTLREGNDELSLMKNSEGYSAEKIPMSTCNANSAE